jgi:hypothetical protein
MAFQTDIYRVWYTDVERGLGGRVGTGQALKNGVSEVGAPRLNISGASAAGQTRSPDCGMAAKTGEEEKLNQQLTAAWVARKSGDCLISTLRPETKQI